MLTNFKTANGQYDLHVRVVAIKVQFVGYDREIWMTFLDTLGYGFDIIL